MKPETIQVLKDTIKQWVKDYNMLDAIIEIKDAMLDDYKDINKSLTETVLNYITKLEQIKVENAALIKKNHKLKEVLQKIQKLCETEYASIDAPQTLLTILDIINNSEV